MSYNLSIYYIYFDIIYSMSMYISTYLYNINIYIYTVLYNVVHNCTILYTYTFHNLQYLPKRRSLGDAARSSSAAYRAELMELRRAEQVLGSMVPYVRRSKLNSCGEVMAALHKAPYRYTQSQHPFHQLGRIAARRGGSR